MSIVSADTCSSKTPKKIPHSKFLLQILILRTIFIYKTNKKYFAVDLPFTTKSWIVFSMYALVKLLLGEVNSESNYHFGSL